MGRHSRVKLQLPGMTFFARPPWMTPTFSVVYGGSNDGSVSPRRGPFAYASMRLSSRAARKMADLPANARRYLERMEKEAGAPIHYVGVGTKREQLIEAA